MKKEDQLQLEIETLKKNLVDAQNANPIIDLSTLESFVLSTTTHVEQYVDPKDKGKIFLARIAKGLGVVAASYLPGIKHTEGESEGIKPENEAKDDKIGDLDA